METSLHQQIKRLVARDSQSIEVNLGSYRIDAIDPQNRLVEVQFGPLGALRDKVQTLCTDHVVRIIKPIITEKQVVTIDPKSREVLRSRKSPKQERPISVFEELLHFTSAFPHPNLIIECWSVQISEFRIDNIRKRSRKRYKVIDVQLNAKTHEFSLRTAADLVQLLGITATSEVFCTESIAAKLGVPRWFAQQIAYVLYKCGAACRVAKRGNSHLYQWHENLLNAPPPARRRRRIAA